MMDKSQTKPKKKSKNTEQMEKDKLIRLEIWQKLLTRPEGVSYKDILQALPEDILYNITDESTIRQEKILIARILKQNGISLIEEKSGRTSRFRVETDNLDLIALYQTDKVSQPYMAMLDMLSKCRGLLPEEFLNSLCDKYKRLSENVNIEKYIAFDTYYDFVQLDYFTDIYKSLNKSALWVSFHPINKPEECIEGQFYPEYLKQYQSNWYAFGMFAEEGKDPTFQKIPLNNIDNCNDEEAEDYPFIKSHIDDYEEYFDDIIGVENPENNEVETITFRISNRMFKRICDKPLHATQYRCTNLDTTGFKGWKICVKYNVELLRTILKLGSDIEIVEPAHIRKRVIKNLKKTLTMYESK